MEVRLIIKQMRDAGMSEKDMLASLEELGIENPKAALRQALAELDSAPPLGVKGTKASAAAVAGPSKQDASATEPAGKGGDTPGNLQITSISDDGEKIVELENMLKGTNQEANTDVMQRMPKSDITNIDDVEYKLDQVIALLKALNDLNKKILESNRDLLLKLSKKESSSANQQKEKLF